MKQPGGLFITGTGTDVGKTVVTTVLCALLKRKGYDCGLFKPIQTGVVKGFCPDLEVYKRFTRLEDAEQLIIPVRLRAPQSPSIAARIEKRKVQIENILGSFYILSRSHKNLLVEGSGGLIVPVTANFLVKDFIRKFRLPALIVSSPALGTINHTCLTAAYLKQQGLATAGIVFSGVERGKMPLFKSVAREIKRITGLPVLGYLGKYDFNRLSPERIIEQAGKTLKMKQIITFFKK